MKLSDFILKNREQLYKHCIKVFCHYPKQEMEILYSFDVLIHEVWKGYFDNFDIKEVSYNFVLNMWYFELMPVLEVMKDE